MNQSNFEISYGQVSVFDANLRNPFNDWTDAHVAQGFAWRPGSVSFGTLDSSGTMTVEISTKPHFDEKTSSSARAISVPFTVPEDGRVEVASITSSSVIQLPAGEYELTFEHGRDDRAKMWANFHFNKVPTPILAKVLRADAELSPPEELIMIAEPA